MRAVAWRPWALAAPVLLAAVGVAAWAHAAAHAAPTAGAIHLNWWAWDSHAPPLGWFIVDFLAFVGGLTYVARPPLRRAFARRHASIKRAISEAAAAHARAAARHTEARARLTGAEAEVRALLQASAADGAAEHRQMVQGATELAAQLRADSASLAAQEVHRASGRLRRAILQQALVEAEALIRRDLSDADRDRLLEQAIVEIEQSTSLAPPRRRRGAARPGGAL